MNTFKKWILLFISVLIISVLVVFIINYVVDPFGVFGDKFFKWYSYNIVNNPRIGKITYLDDNYEKYNSYIIGGSKSSSISPELLNEYYGEDTRFYSMMMYGGEFYDYEKMAVYIIDHYNVENLVIHMSTRELAIYKEDPEINNTMKAEVEGTSRFDYYLRFLKLDLHHSIQKLEGFVRKGYDPFEYGYIMPETGVYDKSRRDIEINETEEEFIERNPNFKNSLGHLEAVAVEDNLRSLKNIKEYCDRHNVSFTFIVAPNYDKEVEQFYKEDFDRFLKGAAKITNFWNFSGYTSIGNDARNFYDPLHYTNRVGKMMLARIFNNNNIYVPEDFGFYVTNENVDRYLTNREQQSIQSLSKVNINLPILMYHNIEINNSEKKNTIVSLNKFKEDMMWLKENNYNTVFFQDVINYIEGKGTLPEKPVIITFDDGYLSIYEYAYPILKQLNMKATSFIIGWSVGRNVHKDGVTPIFPHFSWKQAKEMYNSGLIDIQSHTYDLHENNLSKASRIGISEKDSESYQDYKENLAKDDMLMKDSFNDKIGKSINVIAYPYGIYSDNTVNVIRELGYKASVSTVNGANNIYLGMFNLYNLNRLNITEDKSVESIMLLINK